MTKIIGPLTVGLFAFVFLAAADKPEMKLKVGDQAPSFTAKDADGKVWKSEDHFGKRNIVVYFYPAAMTGGCTKQACSYRDRLPSFNQLDAEIVAISGDEAENLKIFRQAHNLNFTLLADPDGEVARKFGVPVKEGGTIKQTVDGKDIELNRGVTAARWTYVVDKTGRIAYANPEVDAANDGEAVLAVLKELKPE
jgi:thioredoxin-dependent peroxiredoxin